MDLKIDWIISKNHKTKYDISSRIPKYWNDGHLGKLLSNIKEQIFDIILKYSSYIIGRHNLLKNNGIFEYDQKPYDDYVSRSRKTWDIINYIVILLYILFVSYLIVIVILLYIKCAYNRTKGYYWITRSTQWSSSFINNSYW